MIVVIFRTKMKADADLQDYNQCAEHMYELVQQNPGFISVTSYSEPDGGEVTIARFASEESLEAWRTHSEHLLVQQLGRSTFYEDYWIQVCTTVREYEFHQVSGVIHRSYEPS